MNLAQTAVYGAGSNRLKWDGRDSGGARVRAGIYFVEFRTGDQRATGRAVLLD